MPVCVPLEPPDFDFDPERLRAAFTPRTRAIVFNSPNNPSGKVFSRAELQAIAELCREHDLLAITDEIYEHIVYDGLGHTPIATLPGMAERTITISGVSKSYSVTAGGWAGRWRRREISVGIRRAHDFITVGAPHPLQEAAVAALGLPDAYYTELREGYQARRDLLFGEVERAGFVAWKPRGAYYILTDAAHFIKALRLEDDTAFAMWLIKEVGVATCRARRSTPIPSWGGPRSGSASPRPTTCCARPASACRSSARLLVSPREAARAIWRAALAAGDVAPLLRARLRLDGDSPRRRRRPLRARRPAPGDRAGRRQGRRVHGHARSRRFSAIT